MKLLTIIVSLLFVSYYAEAQTENTRERLIDQLKNGTAPGLQFAKNVPAPAATVTKAVEQKESLITQIRKGTAPGMKFMSGPANSAAARTITAPTTSPAQQGSLASEQEMKKESLKPAIVPPANPTQEEPKKEAPAGNQ